MKELPEKNEHHDTPPEQNCTQTIFQQKFSSFYFPLLTVVPPLYRSTHSDVMCISNNGIRVDYDKRKSSSSGSAPSCRLPYEEVYASNHARKMKNKMYGSSSISKSKKSNKNKNKNNCQRDDETLLQQKHKSDYRKKMDRQLHSEHRKYMENLRKEREERLLIETKAAVAIQKFVRGFAVRQRLYPEKYTLWNEKHGLVYSEDEIWTILLDATSKIGITPNETNLLGFSLPRKFQTYGKNR
jgi:hypothetical protein